MYFWEKETSSKFFFQFYRKRVILVNDFSSRVSEFNPEFE